MATPGILKQAVGAALGLSDQLEKIDVHLRNLREAGYITKAKTGRGAAEMSTSDAANLLVAVASSELVKDSVTSVKEYGSLAADPDSVSIHGLRGLLLEIAERRNIDPRTLKGAELSSARARELLGAAGLPLLDLPERHTFMEAARRLLTLPSPHAIFGDGAPTSRHRPPSETRYLFVRFFLPYRAVSVVYGFNRWFQVHLLYGSLPVRDARAAWDLRSLQTVGRLLSVRVVDKVALDKIARALLPSAI